MMDEKWEYNGIVHQLFIDTRMTLSCLSSYWSSRHCWKDLLRV